MTISAVVPTYGRDEVLVETIAALVALEDPPDEIVIVDQTPRHADAVETRLAEWRDEGRIVWRRRARPSIPAAMNDGLLAARGDVVLYLDDDIVPGERLVAAHRAAHGRSAATEIVAGQVLQPGESPEALAGARFGFRSSVAQAVKEFMGGNFSVVRRRAVEWRGFDENFVGAAYRFERDFATRALAAGAAIWFEPAASLRHLRAARGGTRAFGHHLTTVRPSHAVGEYYFLLRNRPPGALASLVARPWRSVRTRHHWRRPWWIPATVTAELSGLLWAIVLAAKGPKLLDHERTAEETT